MTDFRTLAAEKYPYNTPTGYDFKSWAKRIIWRDRQGDKELTDLQVKFASEALNIKKENT